MNSKSAATQRWCKKIQGKSSSIVRLSVVPVLLDKKVGNEVVVLMTYRSHVIQGCPFTLVLEGCPGDWERPSACKAPSAEHYGWAGGSV